MTGHWSWIIDKKFWKTPKCLLFFVNLIDPDNFRGFLQNLGVIFIYPQNSLGESLLSGFFNAKNCGKEELSLTVLLHTPLFCCISERFLKFQKKIMTTPVKKVPIHLQSAQNRLLIKNGTVVNHDKSEVLDVYIEDSRIKQLGNHLIIPGGKTLCLKFPI